MGWFDGDGSDCLYSDETLDLAQEFLTKFSENYRNDLGRKPTVEELEFLLRLSFRTVADETFLHDFAERRIEDVKFKVAKRKKKQDCAVGDLFAVPLPSGGYGFGRVIFYDKIRWNLCEVFAYFSKTKIYKPEVENAARLMYPILGMTHNICNWTYPVVRREPGYESPFLQDLRYVSGEPGRYWVNKVGDIGKGPAVSDEEAATMCKFSYRHPADYAPMIEEDLRKNDLIE